MDALEHGNGEDLGTRFSASSSLRQSTCHVLMIRPVHFGFNEETATTNVFQFRPKDQDITVQNKALAEFDEFVELLRKHGVDVTVVEDTNTPVTPDSIFPNNWISVQPDGSLVMYPMYAPNRRCERQNAEVFSALKRKFAVREIVDLTELESREHYLEGTGAIVADWNNKVLYVARSPRASQEGIQAYQERFPGYRSVLFDAVDGNGVRIYHTNVLMGVGTTWAILCSASIRDMAQRLSVLASLEAGGKEVLDITEEQMTNFAGNVLELRACHGETAPLILISLTGWNSLTNAQRTQLKKHGTPVTPNIPTIESVGGGSARCMVAEIFAPPI